MDCAEVDHGIEYLLAFNGRIHHLEGGYWIKFEIARVEASQSRPHGLRYNFTLHDPNNKRIMGFDNAHGVPAQGSSFKERPVEHDHWHRTGKDKGRPYEFKDAMTLLDDFFDEVERIGSERGFSPAPVAESEVSR